MTEHDVDAAVVHVKALDAIVPIVVTGESARQVDDFVESLRAAWSRCLVDPSRSGEYSDAPTAPVFAHLASGREDAVRARVSSAVTLRGIDDAAGRHLLFHAAALADPVTGLAAAFIGPSGRGKTTAARALGRHFGYLTDETAAVRENGSVLAYPKPLSVRHGEESVKEQCSPDTLALREPGSGPWPLGALVLLDRDPGHAGAPAVSRVPLSEALIAIGPELSALSRLDLPLQRLAALVDRVGPVLRVTYAEAAGLADVTRALLQARSATPERAAPWSPAGIESSREGDDIPVPDPTGSGENGTALTGPSVRRASALDAIVADGHLTVLREGRILSMGGLAPTIWSLTREWVAIDDLVSALVRVLGRPADPHVITVRALTALADEGLVEWRFR